MNECDRTELRLVDELDGTLAEDERGALEEHLAGCCACLETAREWRAIRAAYRERPAADVGSSVAARIVAAGNDSLESASAAPPARPRWRRHAWLPLALAAAAAALLLAYWITPGPAASGEDAPDPVAGLLAEGAAHLASGNFQEALATLEEAERLESEGKRRALVLHRHGQALAAVEAHGEAMERYDEVIEGYPAYEARRDVLLLRGETLVQLGELGRATQAYELLAREFPSAAPDVELRMRELERRIAWEALDLGALGYAADE